MVDVSVQNRGEKTLQKSRFLTKWQMATRDGNTIQVVILELTF